MKERLNTEQISIVNSDGDLFVKAGAGTGKTRTITELYFTLLLNRHYDVKNILAITFTEKAATEMKDRIKNRIKEFTDETTGQRKTDLIKLQKRMNYAWISTLHAFCSRILREFPLQSGIDPVFEIIDQAEKRRRINYTIKNYFNQSGGSTKFKKIKDLAFLYRYDNLLQLFQEALEKNQYPLSKVDLSAFKTKTDDIKSGTIIRQILPEFQIAFEEMASTYQQKNKRDNKLDYDGLLFEVISLLKREDDLRIMLQNRFKCIIVDEFQDTNQQQKEIVDLLSTNENKTVFVGDPKQSIYYFNGADVSVFNQTEKVFDEEETFELFKNYRSNSELIEFFNLIFPEIFVKKPELSYTITYDLLSAEAGEKSEQPVKLLPMADSFEEECENICLYIRKLISEGIQYKEIAILMRRMTKIEVLENVLKRHQIPFHINGSRGFFKKAEIVTLTSFLKAIFEPSDEENLLVLLRSYISPYSDSELVELRVRDKRSLLKAWELYSKDNVRSDHFYEHYRSLRKMANLVTPSKLLREIIETFDYEFIISQLSNPTRRLLNLKKFLEFAQHFDNEISIRRFLAAIEGMEQSNEGEASVDNEKSNVVKVMTIHKSKGLEFPVVILPEMGYVNYAGRSKPNLLVNYESNQIALKDPIDEISGSDYSNMLMIERLKEQEEEKRILYVAFTRAEKELVFSYSQPSKNKNNAPYRNALLACSILKENGKEDMWNDDPDAPVKKYLELISPTSLRENKKHHDDSKQVQDYQETNLQIPNTVYALQEREWKKYISPTVLNENKQIKRVQQSYEIVSDYDLNEHKSEDDKQLGTLVHSVLEDLGEIPLSSITVERISEKLASVPHLDNDLPEIKRMIKTLQRIKTPLIKKIEESTVIYSEVPLRKKFGKYILTGTVDKLFLNNGEWEIVDFKYATGSKTDDDKYAFQIRFYLYCLQQLLNPKPSKGYIYYIKSNKTVEVQQSLDIEKEIEQKILNFEGVI